MDGCSVVRKGEGQRENGKQVGAPTGPTRRCGGADETSLVAGFFQYCSAVEGVVTHPRDMGVVSDNVRHSKTAAQLFLCMGDRKAKVR